MYYSRNRNKALTAIEKEDEKKKIRYSFTSWLLKITCYMQKTLPWANPLLRDLQCLHLLVRKTEEGKGAFSKLDLHLTKVTKTDAFYDKANDEWLLYICEINRKL